MKSVCISVILLLGLSTTYGQRQNCCAPAEAGSITVLVFLAVDCPVSQKYIPVLNSIWNKYKGKPVHIIGLIPGSLKKRNMDSFADEYSIQFPLKNDRDFRCATEIAAEVTPEVFVFDDRCELKYRGAIDNWFYDLGSYRKESTEDYLTDAIDALLAGNNPGITSTKAVGCLIQHPVKSHGAH